MPTGSGKTAVLMMTPFLRRSTRALVVTPSKLVRGQVADDFFGLRVLKRIGVLSDETPNPTVFELKNRVQSEADREAMRAFDVVVATPNGISPEYEGVPTPPAELFDILLIDEAHHSPARTWKVILDCFPKAEKVLFTATPYRQDSREIKGKFVYNYPLRAAFEEKVFGQVRFCPVHPAKEQGADVAIAKAAGQAFKDDVDLAFTDSAGAKRRCPVEEVGLVLDRAATNREQVVFRVVHEGLDYSVRYSLAGQQFFEAVDPALPQPVLIRKSEPHQLLVFLNNHPVTFLCSDYSLVRGSEHVRHGITDFQPLDESAIRVVEWDKHNVDITTEFAVAGPALSSGKLAIHDFLWSYLDRDEFEAVVYDHRVSEAADFITLSREAERVVIGLYHCKGSCEAVAGDRVDDVYEVCGQCIKCLAWVQNEPDLLQHIYKRTLSASKFVRGDYKTVRAQFEHGQKRGFSYRVCLVQPGITKAGLSKKMGEILAATRDYLVRSGVRDFQVLGSA